ncbi:hypothetical protein AXF42_Ash000802 [Apostasia shenzhenica]|uniref:Diphthine--ammonia ligase n=1 Tax=Apostasia shenzhenica TaxID=1088818 RepID=A0A2I0AT44_9ASPA|nr:hypothetical protein AXF42_Ash000802 [Apostasia shenzhenica]
MKVVALVSGGKDSCFAMMKCMDYGHEIVALANLMPIDDSVDELDSYICFFLGFKSVGHQIVVSYAECMGLPLFRRRIQGSMRHQQLSYRFTSGDEVEDLFVLLKEVKQQIPSIAAVSSGAIASDYQRLRVESVCTRLGLVSLAYLWKEDQISLLDEMVGRGILAVVVKVAALGLNPEKHLGRELGDLKSYLLQMNELYGLNVCGEGGEYETITLDCPLFVNARIVLNKFQVILQSPDSIAPVGLLHPLNFHLECKEEAVSCQYRENNNFSSDKENVVFEVDGDFALNCLEKCSSTDHIVDFDTNEQISMCISTCRRGTFSIGCWIQHSDASRGLQNDLTAVLRKIEQQLRNDGLDWMHVLYIHLYISDMKQFALANEVYLRFITEKKCYLGVPSRSTIEVPLTDAVLGNAYVEVLVSNDESKRVLHVQSISCWAPSCIGPYSQATLHKEVLYMAGQLGLDPPTMLLTRGGPAAEMDLALSNCEAVANCFGCSVASSAVFITIYCSVSLSSSEIIAIQDRLELFINKKAVNEEGLGAVNPIFLFVVASNLPKGYDSYNDIGIHETISDTDIANVEVKPVLCLADNGQYEVQSVKLCKPTMDTPNYTFFNFSDWHNSCCDIKLVPARICMAVISVTIDEAARIYSEAYPFPSILRCGNSDRQMKAIVFFLIYLADKIISDNGFTWQELKNLRFYVLKDLVAAENTLFLVFSDAFSEFAEMSKKIDASERPIFNLVPVLGSGRSATMDGLITWGRTKREFRGGRGTLRGFAEATGRKWRRDAMDGSGSGGDGGGGGDGGWTGRGEGRW